MIKVGDVAAMPLPLGGYGACQISWAGTDDLRGGGGGLMTVCVLDWRSDAVPALGDLDSTGPLLLDHHNWSAQPYAHMVKRSDAAPADFVWLGQLPVHPDIPRQTNAFGGWDSLPLQVVLQRQWDLRVSAEAKVAYKNITKGPVMVDLGDVPRTMPATSPLIDLSAHLTQVRWSGLDALPYLTTLRWSGSDRGLIEAIAARPTIQHLAWDDPPSTLDLRTTHLNELTISGNGLRHLRLPPELMKLQLPDEAPEVVEAAEDGRWIRLTTTSPALSVPSGLHGVRHLDVRVAGDLSLIALANLASLESLDIEWTRPHGRLLDAADLSGFRRLHTLRLTDAYGVDASALPHPATSLRRLNVEGIRRSQAKPLRARYKGTAVHVTLRGAKSDTWLAANIDNPLRDWVDDNERAGAAACKAYATALRAIERLPADDSATATGARSVLQNMVEKLNAIDERYEIIDTYRREQAADAFLDLARRAGATDSEAADWFDEWRDF